MNQPLRVLFMGTSDFAVPALRALRASGETLSLVVTQPDRPAGRGLELKASPVKSAALEMGLEIFQPEKVRTPEVVEKLKSVQPDLAVVAAYGQILPIAVLNIPKLACLNIHGSILPKYRGAAPIHYAVIAGEKETGVTIMYMNEKMDEGDILLSKTTAIGPEETTGEIHDRLAVLGAEGLSEAVKLLKQTKAPRIPRKPPRPPMPHRSSGRFAASIGPRRGPASQPREGFESLARIGNFLEGFGNKNTPRFRGRPKGKAGGGFGSIQKGHFGGGRGRVPPTFRNPARR